MSVNDRNLRDPDIAPDLLAHDLRAAVAGIISSLGLISPDNLSEFEKRSLRQARVSADTLRDLLDISMGAATNSKKSLALADIARRVDNRWRTSAEDKGLSLQVHLSTDAPSTLLCAPAELNRIFDNLLGNALKYCDTGAITLAFGGDQNGGLRVLLEDDGPGFSTQAMQTLFEFHGRPLDAGKDGSGLGLYITKSLMDRLDAKIDVENRKGGGARITLRFPETICDVVVSQNAAAKPTPMGAGLPDLSHLRILVAEDNLTNQLVVGQMLEAMGASFALASDGVEALELFERESFDLVLLDIEMPRMTGLDVIRRIRARSDGREATPLLALTAYAMPDHVRRIRQEGASGLIAKPLTSLSDFGRALLDYSSDETVQKGQDGEKPPLGDLAEIDRAIYDSLAQTMGPQVMGDLLEKIASDLDDVHERLENGRRQQDVDAIRGATHILISLAGAIGATNLQHFAQALNGRVKTEPWARVVPQIEQALDAVEQLLSFVAKEIGNW